MFLKGHKKAITAMEWSSDNKSIFTASKDCCLIQCIYYFLSSNLRYRGFRELEEAILQGREA